MRLLAIALLAILLSAGCIGASKDPVKKESTNATNDTASNPVLPDGRGVSSGNVETNKTTTGAGGVAHTHDYWNGRETVVIWQRNVRPDLFPLEPDGQGSAPRGVLYITLPQPVLVYEGTDALTIDAKPSGSTTVPLSLRVQYRSAADSAWRDAGNLAMGTPLRIKVLPKETDMPHSTSSLWAFRVSTDRPQTFFFDSFNLTMTIHKGADILSWPGHPDFYAGSPTRVVIDKDVKTRKDGGAAIALYEPDDEWVHPDRLISYGTGHLEIWANVTSVTPPAPTMPPTGYALAVHNATSLGVSQFDNYTLYQEANGKNDLKSYHFVVPIEASGMDSPYQPASRWGFQLDAGFGIPSVAVFGGFGCTDCFAYDVSYHLTIIAVKGDDAMAGMVM